MCLVAQVSSIPSHRVAINSGFQINYQLPFRLQDFYSPIYWARALSNVSSPALNFFERFVESEAKNEDDNEASGDVEVEDVDDISEETTTIYPEELEKHETKRELSAGQFYSGIMETMS